MTREEALQILDTIPTIGEQVDALEMAIQALSQEPCDDVVSREAVIEWLENATYEDISYAVGTELSFLHSVTQKSGHWIEHQDGRWIYAKCSECGTVHDTQTNYCPNCGTKMESEDKE